MKNIEGELKTKEGSNNPFTIEGFNDKARLCLEEGCNGMVMPTRNANVGVCNECHQRYNWGNYRIRIKCNYKS